MIVNALPTDQGIIRSYSSIICSYSSFINVAKYYNNNICEELVFFKRNGLKVETNIDTISSLKNIIISTKFNEIVIGFLNDYNIENKPIIFDNYLETKEYIYEQINHLNPIIIRVNSNLLNYGPTNLQNSNRNHTLVISGFNRETEEIYFYDYFIPTYPSKIFYGSMNIDDFGKMVVKNDKYNIFYFDYLKVQEIFGVYEKSEFMSDLKDNIDTYMNNFETMELIADTINNLLSKFSKEDILKNSRELVHHIMYRSIIPSRILLRNVCQKYEWSTFYNEFDTIALEWYTISLLLIKYSFIPLKENYNKISQKIFTLLEKEKSIISSMRNLC